MYLCMRDISVNINYCMAVEDGWDGLGSGFGLLFDDCGTGFRFE